MGQFEDADDSVVPSTPKLVSSSEKPASPQVPSAFFGGQPQASSVSEPGSSQVTPTFASLAASASASTSSSIFGSPMKGGQEGIDRTNVDFGATAKVFGSAPVFASKTKPEEAAAVADTTQQPSSSSEAPKPQGARSKISRTPIVWSPPGTSGSAQSSGPAQPSTSSAAPPVRGRGTATARRSRRPGGGTRGTRGSK